MISKNDVMTLLSQYNKILETLKDGGIIKTGSLTGCIGEYLVAEKLDLILEIKGNNKDFDGKDKYEKRYEIKSGKVQKKGRRIPSFVVKQNKFEGSDFIVLCGLDYDWEIKDLIVIPSDKAKKLTNKDDRISNTKKLRDEYSYKETQK